MCDHGLLSSVNSHPQQGEIEKGLTVLRRVNDHQSKDNCGSGTNEPKPLNQAVRNVPPSNTMTTTQFAKTSLVALITIHPRYISGYGLWMTRRKVLALTVRIKNGK